MSKKSQPTLYLLNNYQSERTMNALTKFNRGVLNMPLHWQAWVVIIVYCNVVVPFFYINQTEAQVVLATTLVSAVIVAMLTGHFGFTRIVGLGHVVWLPMLAYLSARLEAIPATDLYGVWVRSLFVLNGISLVIDAVDAFRYVAGESNETVPGL